MHVDARNISPARDHVSRDQRVARGENISFCFMTNPQEIRNLGDPKASWGTAHVVCFGKMNLSLE